MDGTNSFDSDWAKRNGVKTEDLLLIDNISASLLGIEFTAEQVFKFLKDFITSKEIASIIFISPESVKTARKRFRKKLNLAPEQNLTAFLMDF